jgi:hypothetical protein
MWECGDCGRPETSRLPLDNACHHCGLLLCRDCCKVVVDGIFGGPLIDAGRAASHCRVCRRRYHRLGVPLGSGTDT